MPPQTPLRHSPDADRVLTPRTLLYPLPSLQQEGGQRRRLPCAAPARHNLCRAIRNSSVGWRTSSTAFRPPLAYPPCPRPHRRRARVYPTQKTGNESGYRRPSVVTDPQSWQSRRPLCPCRRAGDIELAAGSRLRPLRAALGRPLRQRAHSGPPRLAAAPFCALLFRVHSGPSPAGAAGSGNEAVRAVDGRWRVAHPLGVPFAAADRRPRGPHGRQRIALPLPAATLDARVVGLLPRPRRSVGRQRHGGTAVPPRRGVVVKGGEKCTQRAPSQPRPSCMRRGDGGTNAGHARREVDGGGGGQRGRRRP